MFAPQPGINDWTKQNLQPDPVDLATVNCAYSCLADGLNYPECPVHGEIDDSIHKVAEQGALIAGTSSADVEAAVREFVTPAMMAAAQPLISEDPRPRCGDQYTVQQKFGASFVVACDKYEGHTAPENNRPSRRHWNVQHKTGWFTRRDS